MRSRPLADRLWEKVDRSGGEAACWPFLGSKNRLGYGQMRLGFAGLRIGPHAAAYLLAAGDLDRDLEILHSCDNRACCNPAHLRQDTHAANQREMVERGRSIRGPRHWAWIDGRRSGGVSH